MTVHNAVILLASTALDGLTRTTSVIYTSDHGEALGRRDHWGKSNLYGECTHNRIAALAAAARLPAIYGFRDHVDAGGLASYGASMRATPASSVGPSS
jgi:glucan phosphoethanolaminetransferase (alkaline phosphatase superfamily)